MAKDRLILHDELITLLGSSNVYFQPPTSIKMNYPCIIYKLDDVEYTPMIEDTLVQKIFSNCG